MRNSMLFAAALALLAGSTARAGTIEVNSTTLLNVARQTRDGLPGEKPDLVTTAPAFEILSLTARDVTNGFADDLTIVLSTWGANDFDHRRWDNGTNHDLTGDVMIGYVQGRLLDRHLTLRVGRAQVQTGVARMIQLDGGEAIGLLPLGFRLSAYAGVPVSERFASRTGFRNWNPLGGDFAWGSRLAWALPLPGIPARGLELGASVNMVSDGGDPVRREVGADMRLRPVAPLTVTASGAYSIYDERMSELLGRIDYSATRNLVIDLDYRFVAPDLFLSRESILSVFSDEQRHFIGGGASYRVGRDVRLTANYHLALEPSRSGNNDYMGHEADAGLEWERHQSLAGAEAFLLDSFDNGYVGGRVFGRQDFGRAFAAADVLLHAFRERVNGEKISLTGTLSAGYELVRGLSAVLAGRAGTTPFLENTFEFMAKLVYGQTYYKTEMR